VVIEAIVLLFVTFACAWLLIHHHEADHDSEQRVIDRVEAVLPQTQCRQCGYPGCRPYAEGIVRAGAPLDACPPGGPAALRSLSELLGRDAGRRVGLEAEHLQLVAVIDEALCIGCTKCIQACPVDAIVGANKQMHSVIRDDCTGCDLCVPPCPVDCIAMVARAPHGAGRGWSRPHDPYAGPMTA
jgi:electron transport complex protein RnfB